MKYIKLLIISISFLASVPGNAEDVPYEVQTLQSRRNEKMKEINLIYLKELEKLKDKYTKQGDLDKAILVVSLMTGVNKEIQPQSVNREIQPQSINLNGKWLSGNIGRSERYLREFKDEIMIDQNGTDHEMIIKNNVIIIKWGADAFEKLYYDPKNPDVVKGMNSSNDAIIYTRVKEQTSAPQPQQTEIPPARSSTTTPAAGLGPPRRSLTGLRSREELLAAAKQNLDADQLAMAEQMRFSDFRFNRPMTGSYCLVDFSTTASVEEIQKIGGLRVRVRYLCENADKRMLVLEGFADMKPNVRKGEVGAGSGMDTAQVAENNNGKGTPLNAHAIIYYHGVPIFEGVWQKTGRYASYSRGGQTPWWEDEELIKK